MTKTIQINPEFLSSTSSKKKDVKQKKKEKPIYNIVEPNKIRMELLKRIKEHQSKKDSNEHNQKNDDILEKDFKSGYDETLHFLQNLTKKKNTHLKKNKTRKNINSYDEVDIELPYEMLNIDNDASSTDIVTDTVVPNTVVPNTALPNTSVSNTAASNTAVSNTAIMPNTISSNTVITNTVVPKSVSFENNITPTREYINSNNNVIVDTQPMEIKIDNMDKNIDREYPKIVLKPSVYSSMKNGSKPTYREMKNEHKPKLIIEDKQEPKVSENHRILEKIKSDYKKKNEPAKKEKKTIKTRRTVLLGRLGNKVSVFIKDNKTRKLIKSECNKLDNTNIVYIKNYLRKKNLLKSGSIADESLLREIYKQCILTGDVNNNNKETLIHNYLTKV